MPSWEHIHYWEGEGKGRDGQSQSSKNKLKCLKTERKTRNGKYEKYRLLEERLKRDIIKACD